MNKLSIKEIKDRLKNVSTLDDPFVQSMQQDERKGVQTALAQLKTSIGTAGSKLRGLQRAFQI